jgi:hypothetical protein
MRDIDMSLKQLEDKYGKLTYMEKAGHFVDSGGHVRRINHSRANGDFMDEMEEGRLFHSLEEDFNLTMEKLEEKYGKLTLEEGYYYVDKDDIIRRILPYRPLVR